MLAHDVSVFWEICNAFAELRVSTVASLRL
jgi:hypothetical protein